MDETDDDVRRLAETWRLGRDLARSGNPIARDCGSTILAEVRAALRLIDPLSYEAEDNDQARSRSS